jgi:type IV secretory pathway VirB10-like protein
MFNNNQDFEAFLKQPVGDKQIKLNVSRNTVVAIAFSLLLHALFLFWAPKIKQDNATVLPAREITVSLAPATPTKKIAPDPIEKPASPLAEKAAPTVTPPVKKSPTVITQKPVVKAKPPVFKVPEVLVTPEPAREKIPPNLSLPTETPPSEAPLEKAPTDMSEYIALQQSRNAAKERDAAKQNADAVAREIGPSAEQVRDERIKRNFQNGTNGIFEITSLGNRNATFAFRGWTTDFTTSRKEFFEVEAKSGQDVRLVMIKKMIGLIRQHYQGDFNWESQRLNRTIIMSARLEDSAGLEDFMMMEFFGERYKTQ